MDNHIRLAHMQNIRKDLIRLCHPQIDHCITALKLEMDDEISEEIRERIAVMMFNEMVNDMPMVSYVTVWEDGAAEIAHAYMSPSIESISGYTPQELVEIGYKNIVRGDILQFNRDIAGVEENVNPVSEARKKRVGGFLENRSWEGCYQIMRKGGRMVWVVDRSLITRFRNTVNGNIVCLACGILLESTELFERHAQNSRGR
ncbi:MAG: hypothetical protein R6U50_10210 [Desulfobacterales bacterium]